MDAPSTVLHSSTRRQFFARLLLLKQPQVNLSSMALGMGVNPSTLTRYLREAVNAGWLSARKLYGGTEIVILDRAALERVANGTGEAVRGQVTAGGRQG
ncbi:MAG TPA: hypothetical protein VIV15_12255 [Anaerolineales bacterium]